MWILFEGGYFRHAGTVRGNTVVFNKPLTESSHELIHVFFCYCAKSLETNTNEIMLRVTCLACDRFEHMNLHVHGKHH